MILDFDGFKINVGEYTNLHLYLEALDSVKELIENDYDFLQIVDGKLKTGVGKSTMALLSARYVDENFNADKIAFSDIKQILRLVRKASAGDAVVIDEGGTILFSKQWRNKEVILFNKVLMIARAKRLFLQVVLPSVFYLDKYVRLSIHGLVSIKQRGLAEYYFGKEIVKAWALHIKTMNPRHQRLSKTPQPAFVFEYPKLDGWKLYEEYLQRKMEFIDKQLEEWEKELELELENLADDTPNGYLFIEDIAKKLHEHGIDVPYTTLYYTIRTLPIEIKKIKNKLAIAEEDFNYVLDAIINKRKVMPII